MRNGDNSHQSLYHASKLKRYSSTALSFSHSAELYLSRFLTCVQQQRFGFLFGSSVISCSRRLYMPDGMMRAVQYTSYGGGPAALQPVNVWIPSPKAGEILIKIEAASVNPIDWKIQSGTLRPLLPPKFPFIPGIDIAGKVEALGPRVDTFAVGDRVVSWLDVKRGGAFAEFAVVPCLAAVKLPAGVSAIEGACLPVAGMTALQTIRDYAGMKLHGHSGKNLLITAASGGVGLLAVQIGKLAGAHVTATCGARNMELLKNLGADEVLDYRTPDGDKLKSPSGRRYDAVIHCATDIPWSKFEPNLAAGGQVIDITPSLKSIALTIVKKITFSQKQIVPIVMSANKKDLKILVDLVDSGRLKIMIDSKYPLSKANEAFARSIEGHATGKIVVIKE